MPPLSVVGTALHRRVQPKNEDRNGGMDSDLEELNQLEIGDSADGGFGSLDDEQDVDVGTLKLDFHRKGTETKQRQEIFEHPYVSNPDARWRSSWDAMMITVLVWIGVTVPYRLAFDSPAKGGWLIINIFTELVLLSDIVVNFRTAYFDAELGHVITDPKLIADRYLKSWAVLDIPSATPFEILNAIFYVDPSLRLMQMVRLVQLLRIFRVARALKDVQAAFHKILNSTLGLLRVNISYSALKIGKLFTGLVIIAHFNACLWYRIGLHNNSPTTLEDEETAGALGGTGGDTVPGYDLGDVPWQQGTETELGWVNHYEYADRVPFDLYCISFYFVFTCMTTVGFGDITPHTMSETIFSIYCMFIGCTVFGYIVGMMSSEASSSNNDEEYLHKIDYLDQLMQTHNVKKSIRRRVQRHYTYLKETGTGYAQREIFPELPHSLRRDLVLSLNHTNKTNSIEMMSGRSFDYEWCAELQLIMKPSVMDKHEMVCRIGELAQEIFVLKTGEAQIFHPPSARSGRAVPLKVMSQGSSFGDESLLGRRRYEFTARTIHQGTVLYLIRSEAMANLLEAFPNVRRELRQRAAEKLKELHRVAKQQARAGKGAGADDASGGNPMSIMDDTYGEPERSGAAADAADATAAVADGEAGNAEAIARVEKKVDLLTEQMDYMVKSFNAAAGLADG